MLCLDLSGVCMEYAVRPLQLEADSQVVAVSFVSS
jgi:hypothetical protein